MTTRKVISVFLLAVTLLFSAQQTSYAEPYGGKSGSGGVTGWIAAGILGVVAVIGIVAVSVRNGDDSPDMHPLDLDEPLDDESSYDDEDAVDGEGDTSIPADSVEIETTSVQTSQIQSVSVPVVNNSMSDSEMM